jgi:hypothetical protein
VCLEICSDCALCTASATGVAHAQASTWIYRRRRGKCSAETPESTRTSTQSHSSDGADRRGGRDGQKHADSTLWPRPGVRALDTAVDPPWSHLATDLILISTKSRKIYSRDLIRNEHFAARSRAIAQCGSLSCFLANFRGGFRVRQVYVRCAAPFPQPSALKITHFLVLTAADCRAVRTIQDSRGRGA